MTGPRRLVAPVILGLLAMLLSVGGAPPTDASVDDDQTAPPEQVDSTIVVGRASWVASSLGDRYLALPRVRRGTRVRICGAVGCVERVSTDVGPDQRVFPDRVADMSRRDFEAVSGLATPEHGTALVSVEYLDHPNHPNPSSRPTPPPTDA